MTRFLLIALLIGFPFHDDGNSPMYDVGAHYDDLGRLSHFGDQFGPSPVWEYNPESNRGGLASLPATITVANGNSGTLIGRYEGADANATDWAATGTGNTLTAGGSGGSFGNGSPTNGITDQSTDPEGTRHWLDSGTTFGNLGTSDFIVEVIIYLTGGGDHLILSKQIHTGSLQGYNFVGDVTGSPRVSFTLDTGPAIASVNSATITINSWSHILGFADRDGSMQWYVNGTTSGAATSISGASATLNSASPFRLAAGRNAVLPSESFIAYAAMWTVSDIGTHSQNAVAAERFSRLTGTYPDESPTFTRATSAHLVKEVSTDTYQSFTVGPGWPRNIKHPALGTCYLSEGSDTNLCLQSEDFDTSWGKDDVGDITGGSIAGVDGISCTTCGFIADSTSGTHGRRQDITVTTGEIVSSCWFQPGDLNWILMFEDDTSTGKYVNVSTCVEGGNGPGGAPLASGVIDYGSWCYVWISTTQSDTSFRFRLLTAEADGDITFAGDGATVNTYAWGCQVEDNNLRYPSSYIKTTTASATRNDDVLEYTMPSEAEVSGTVASAFTHYDMEASTNTDTIVEVENTSTAYINLGVTSSATTGNMTVVNATTQADIADSSGTNITDGARHTISGSYEANNFQLFVDSISGGVDTSGSKPTLSAIRVGTDVSSSTGADTCIHNVRIYDRTGVAE